jgi:tetratricopeptide (TPR) repeat protein
MKFIIKSIIYLVILLPFIFFAQSPQNKKSIDSLLSAYEGNTNYEKQVETAQVIFETALENTPKLAKEYAYKLLSLSAKNNYLKGKARAYKSLEEYYSKYRNNDSILFYIPKAAEAFGHVGNKEMQVKSLIIWSKMEMKNGQYKESVAIADRSLSIAKEAEKGGLISDAHNQKGTIFLRQGLYDKTTEQFLRALEVCDTLVPRDLKKEANNKTGLGIVEVRRGNPEKAIPYFEESLRIFEQLQDVYSMLGTTLELGNANVVLGDHKNALKYFEKSIEYSLAMKREDFEAICMGSIASVYMKTENYSKALTNLLRAVEITKRMGAKSNLINGYGDLAFVYMKQGKFQEALRYANKSIALSDSTSSIHNLMRGFKLRIDIAKEMNEPKKALVDFETYISLKDSVFNEKKSLQIEELKTKYETEKKEQQIAQQETEISLLEEKEKVSDLQKMLLGGGLGLSAIALGLGFYGFRQRIKRNRLEKEKLDAQLLLKESELDFKKKELTTHALHLAKKNEVLEGLKQKATELNRTEEGGKAYQELIRTINFDQQDDKVWENFTRYFEAVHKDFEKQVVSRYPDITKNEIRLMALLKMNMSSKEIANILNISADGVKKARQRLRKKMNLSPEDSLETTVMSI